MPQEINLFNGSDAPLSLGLLLMNLGVGIVMALIIRWHFNRFGSTLSNREEFAQVFPFILLTTVLIITVVKSSLALSLGLVGALSIVRFRTPIKEPEELAYLFVSIAMGLGLGANQTVPTVVAGLTILGAMAALKLARLKGKGRSKNLFLSIDWEVPQEGQSDRHLELLNEIVARHVINCDLRRFDTRSDYMEATYFIDITGTDNLSALADELRRSFPSVGVTFLDQNQMPSI